MCTVECILVCIVECILVCIVECVLVEHYQYSVSKDTILEQIHQLRDIGIKVISLVPLAYVPLQIKLAKRHHGFSVYFTHDLTPSCWSYTNQWFEVWLNTAVHYGIPQKPAISKNWRVYRKNSQNIRNARFSLVGSSGLSISDVYSTKFMLSLPDKPPVRIQGIYSSKYELSAVLA